MSMRILKDRIKARLRQQVPLAGEINPDHFLRAFYLENILPEQPSPQAVQRAADLKNAITQSGDLFGLLNQGNPQSVTVTDAVKFDLPWEKRFNWGRVSLALLSILEALAALYTLQVFGIINLWSKLFGL